LRELDPAITTGLLIGPHDHGRDLRGRGAACGAQLLCPHVSQVTDALRSTAARSGPLVVLVWTVNESRLLAGMLRDAAVGCVITDVPEVALAIRDAGLSGQPPRGRSCSGRWCADASPRTYSRDGSRCGR
jgi:glycerophosphoryl diester phosphodiesterase